MDRYGNEDFKGTRDSNQYQSIFHGSYFKKFDQRADQANTDYIVDVPRLIENKPEGYHGCSDE